MPNYQILVTGALGQIGRVLIDSLVATHGRDAVLATDLLYQVPDLPCDYQSLDATDSLAWDQLVTRFNFKEVYHLVAVLSAKGEANPWHSWQINMSAWQNVLEAAKHWRGCKVFFPSSIAVYGPPLPKSVDESQVLRPTTSYGISKMAGERWGGYAFRTDGIDVRTLRLPGVIGYQTMPGGGTTDYAVDIYHAAVKGEKFICFLKPDARLPMIYMDDLLRGIAEFMAADRDQLNEDGVYNLAGYSIDPREIAAAIQQHYPAFEIVYAPDHRQAIAASWPAELDGSLAKKDWNWRPAYDNTRTTAEMISALKERYPSTSKP